MLQRPAERAGLASLKIVTVGFEAGDQFGLVQRLGGDMSFFLRVLEFCMELTCALFG